MFTFVHADKTDRAMSNKDAKEAVYKYLKLQNRPYSANDVMQNLHNEFGKTAVQKAMDDLTRENKIREKVYGKQKVYCPIQDDVNSAEMEVEIVELDSKIEKLTESLRKAEGELKLSETTLRELKKVPSMEDCTREKRDLEDEVKRLTKKVEDLSKLDVKISDKDRNQMIKDRENHLKEYRKRKRICMDILNSILENCPKPKKALLEEIGIETDEDVGFKLSL